VSSLLLRRGVVVVRVVARVATRRLVATGEMWARTSLLCDEPFLCTTANGNAVVVSDA
jgi:hypothetical protein